jgi:hypothetical protein
MATDTDKMVAATLAAALLQPTQSSGEVGGMVKAHSAAAKQAAAIYRDILAAIQEAA